MPWHSERTCGQYKASIAAPDAATADWMARNTKKCPKCDGITEKAGGCDHMVRAPTECTISWAAAVVLSTDRPRVIAGGLPTAFVRGPALAAGPPLRVASEARRGLLLVQTCRPPGGCGGQYCCAHAPHSLIHRSFRLLRLLTTSDSLVLCAGVGLCSADWAPIVARGGGNHMHRPTCQYYAALPPGHPR